MHWVRPLRPYRLLSAPLFFFFFESYADHRDLHSFPTRRSSDLLCESLLPLGHGGEGHRLRRLGDPLDETRDRKSTRLNSSHANISYAVFCLKKKKSCRKRSGQSSSSCLRKSEQHTTSRPVAAGT